MYGTKITNLLSIYIIHELLIYISTDVHRCHIDEVYQEMKFTCYTDEDIPLLMLHTDEVQIYR